MIENQREWGARLALACYLALIGGIFLGSIIFELLLWIMNVKTSDLTFPIALISAPVTETIVLAITLFFARHKQASLTSLGLKKVSLKILVIVSVIPVPLIFLAGSISIFETSVFGPDPMAEQYRDYIMPRDSFQLITMIALFLVLVGPVEELAFRGFIQKGFENSFGKLKGLLIASVLFALVHGLNSAYYFAPVFAVGLVVGYVWQRTGGNTTASALMHAVYNSVQIILTYLITM